MKAGLAVMLELARTVREPAVDVTYVFYEAEEIDAIAQRARASCSASGPTCWPATSPSSASRPTARSRPGARARCAREVVLAGARAHTARPWMGRNAIHRLGPVLTRLAAYEERRPVLDGCEYREALQAVLVEGGVAGNVVPDRARSSVNHRFAPDRSAAEAEAMLRDLLFADGSRTATRSRSSTAHRRRAALARPPAAREP